MYRAADAAVRIASARVGIGGIRQVLPLLAPARVGIGGGADLVLRAHVYRDWRTKSWSRGLEGLTGGRLDAWGLEDEDFPELERKGKTWQHQKSPVIW